MNAFTPIFQKKSAQYERPLLILVGGHRKNSHAVTIKFLLQESMVSFENPDTQDIRRLKQEPGIRFAITRCEHLSAPYLPWILFPDTLIPGENARHASVGR